MGLHTRPTPQKDWSEQTIIAATGNAMASIESLRDLGQESAIAAIHRMTERVLKEMRDGSPNR